MITPVRSGNKPTFGLSDALVLAGIPGVAFTIVALFQAGHLAYFGLPLSSMNLDAASVFGVLGDMFRVAVTYWPGALLLLSLLVVGIPAIPFILPLSRTDKTLKRIPGALLAISLISLSLTPFIWAPFHVPLVALFYFVYLLLTGTNYSVPANAIHIEKWFSLGVFRLIVVGLLAVPTAFLAGYKLAEGGLWLDGGRQVAATIEKGLTRYYLIAAVRPDHALGIEIVADQKSPKSTLTTWKFGSMSPIMAGTSRNVLKLSRYKPSLRFVIFDHALQGGIQRCESPNELVSGRRNWFFYRPIEPAGAYIRLACAKSDIPITRVTDKTE